MSIYTTKSDMVEVSEVSDAPEMKGLARPAPADAQPPPGYVYVVNIWHFALPDNVVWAYSSLEDAVHSGLIALNRMRRDVGLLAVSDPLVFRSALKELQAAIALVESGEFDPDEDLGESAGCDIYIERIPLGTPEILAAHAAEPLHDPHPDNVAIGARNALVIRSESESAWWNAQRGWVDDVKRATLFDLSAAIDFEMPHTDDGDAIFALIDIDETTAPKAN